MKTKIAFSLVLILLLGLTACSLTGLPVNPPPASTNTLDPQQIDQAIAATLAAQTQVAISVEQTLTAVALENSAFTPAPSDTSGLALTATPSATFTPTMTVTPNVPMVTVSSETNCRSGPGQAYDKLGVLNPGETTEVVGRTTVENYWLVRNPDNPAQVCWLWGQYATVTGDWQSLPQATQPPTPTPVAGFTITYLGVVTCGADSALRLEVKNTGSTTWRSIKVDMTDSTTSTSKTHSSDNFADRAGCAISNSLIDLEPNEIGIVVTAMPGHFSYNITGHNITVTVTLYSQDGLTGDSSTKTISVTP